MSDFITQSEFAQREGVSKNAVSKWKKEGRLVFRKGKVDYEATKKLLSDTADPARAKADGSFAYARTVKEAARAKLTQLKVKQVEGELVNAKELQRELMTLFTTIKTRIRAVAPKCAQEIGHLKASNMKNKELLAAVQEILKKEHDDALQELSEWK